jgi:hypothetical protein
MRAQGKISFPKLPDVRLADEPWAPEGPVACEKEGGATPILLQELGSPHRTLVAIVYGENHIAAWDPLAEPKPGFELLEALNPIAFAM